MGTIPSGGSARVLWREGTWWCELGMVLGYPVLRLYDGDTVELEHEIMPGTISETAEVMRLAVLRYVSGHEKARTPTRTDPEDVGTSGGAGTTCPHCRSHRAYLWGSRPGEERYFCADCACRWDSPWPS
jgi:hypothetical protein